MNESDHFKRVKPLQEKIRSLGSERKTSPLSLKYLNKTSNTTRSKLYKQGCSQLDLSGLNHILIIDPEKHLAIVEPRVTMEELLKAALRYGLTPPVVPECKDITVGGAIMGIAGESSSHRWGCFHDTCKAYEILCGDGTLLRASPIENQDIYHGIAGSYGSLGVLLKAEIELIPAKPFVHLRTHSFKDPPEAIALIQKLSQTSQPPDFLEGIIFEKNFAVVIEGKLSEEKNLPIFSQKPLHAEWFFQHIKKCPAEELIPYSDYIFRYDQGAFWMGAYLFHIPLLTRFIKEEALNFSHKEYPPFNKEEIEKWHVVPNPGPVGRMLSHPFMTSKRLWNLLHLSEKWVKDRFLIQDICIPEANAPNFLQEIVNHPGVFPIWLCPIKGTFQPQIFAPHIGEKLFINFGIYGIPSFFAPMEQLIENLEETARTFQGRKVLYSHSSYTEEEFWNIYNFDAYQALRSKISAEGIWHSITDKVLTE